MYSLVSPYQFPVLTWVPSKKRCEGVDWPDVAWDRFEERSAVKTVKIPGAIKGREFLY
jgi:hypothetical protein